MAHFKTAVVVLVSISIAACVEHGRPVIADRSPDFGESNPSVVPDGRAQPRATVTRPKSRRNVPAGTSNVLIERAKVRAPAQYIVRAGDSLFSIAWRFELDHRVLARLNNIPAPYVIYPGRILNLKEDRTRTTVVGVKKPTVTKPSNPPRTGVAARRSAKPPTPAKVEPTKPTIDPPVSQPIRTAATKDWMWPVAGKPSRAYSKNSKGVDFTIGANNSAVRASNSGQVVYAGNGIGGFSQLIIIRHDQELLSAYSFNGTTRIAEQDSVKAGQKIADISFTGRSSQKLHFELRKHGKPINPGSIIR